VKLRVTIISHSVMVLFIIVKFIIVFIDVEKVQRAVRRLGDVVRNLRNLDE
jgi:hypothetical protein